MVFESLRDFASKSLLNRIIAYTGVTLASFVLATILVALFKLQLTPAWVLLISLIIMAAGYYVVDPENEYTEADVIAVAAGAILALVVVAILSMVGYAAIIKQYAAPVIFLQEATEAAANAVGATNSIITLSLMNILVWIGVSFTAFATKYYVSMKASPM